ncbi:hypothetical protein BG011_002195 [Mortierella polycephala]|uniref:Uncharacterized protein n=1 Tax=Mortierella polycephala TaxID=41804 RepID=A0A9P6Q4Z1_9FUNG|nr:hypothetical protein BG011_002195 [Mortierella polycephala]
MSYNGPPFWDIKFQKEYDALEIEMRRIQRELKNLNNNSGSDSSSFNRSIMRHEAAFHGDFDGETMEDYLEYENALVTKSRRLVEIQYRLSELSAVKLRPYDARDPMAALEDRTRIAET